MAMAAGTEGSSGTGGAPPTGGTSSSTSTAAAAGAAAPSTTMSAECTIESLQKEIEHLKNRIKEERFKLQDKTIGQVCFNNVTINKGL